MLINSTFYNENYINKPFGAISSLPPLCDTVTVDIFACIHFRAFPKIDNFAQTYICVFDIAASMWHNKSSFHDVYISRIFNKREIMYSAKISAFTDLLTVLIL